MRAFAALLLLVALLPPAGADDLSDARLQLASGDLPAALQRAQAAATANPQSAQARFLVGVVLMEMQRDDEALAQFTQMSQEFPELPEPLNNIALIHARHGRLEQSRQALESALRNDPGHRASRVNLGQIHLMLAVQNWELAAAGGPIDPVVKRRLEGARTLLHSSPRPVP